MELAEARNVQEWCVSEAHYRRALKSLRRSLYIARIQREQSDDTAKRMLQELNAIKIKAREMGWSEETK